MGSFSYMTVADYPIYENKNDYIPEFVNMLFQPEDFIAEKRKFTTRSKIFWGDAYEKEKGSFTFKGFRQTVGVCKKRLEIYGMNIKRVRDDFKSAKIIADEAEYYSPKFDFPFFKLSFNTYLKELKDIITTQAHNSDGLHDTLQNALITDNLRLGGQEAIPSLYAILSCLEEDKFVEYDLTDILYGGWVKEQDAVNIKVEKIIILTEGKTDADFLSKALKKLYPYLDPYYHFMDFGGFKVDGSVSALVKTLKAFAAANVQHPIVALFDNDTAGIAEMKNLPKNLPDNIKSMKLPDVKIAKNYPTKGPGGSKKMNINGLACGIEMYLGKEILEINGSYSNIRWSNYDTSLKQYQGSLEDKVIIQKVFLEKIKNNEHWEMPEMELVFDQIFKAFQPK